MSQLTVVIRGRKYTASTKADIAREALREGASVSEVSKAVPMAYSQVHSIHQKMGTPTTRTQAAVKHAQRFGGKALSKATRIVAAVCDPAIDLHVLPHSPGCPKGVMAANKRRAKQVATITKPRNGVGRLRVPGNPLDTPTGPCANCGNQTAIKKTPSGFVFKHVGVSAEEYLSTTQFCQVVPESLL